MRLTARTRKLRDSAVLGLLITTLGVALPVDNQHLLSATDFSRTVEWVEETEHSPYSQALASSVKDGPEYVPAALPEHTERSVERSVQLMATAYSSSLDETSGDPNITATGTQTRWGVVASNYLPLGTEFRMPELYGDQIFRVEDTHSSRLGPRIDVWHPSKGEALQFGVKRGVELEILVI